MSDRLKLHFEPEKGWINDPNGLIFWRGQYHAFFQHNPYAPEWAQMHWGHAVSDDLLHWRELPIALYPDQPYEDSDRGGCFSGSAVEADGKLWLIYTTVSRALGQTQSVAFTEDGVKYEKYAGNPVIPHFPADGSADFRDPKVIRLGDSWTMVTASGKDGVGRALRYVSRDLLHWDYAGVLFENAAFGGVYECTDFFPLDGKYVLMFSKMHTAQRAVQFVIGDFDGEKFTPETFTTPEIGPHFYAPQTFAAPDGRRILIGWMHSRGDLPGDDGVRKGAFTLPRQLSIRDGKLLCAPIDEAAPYLTESDDAVEADAHHVRVRVRAGDVPQSWEGDVREVKILRDARTLEVFINGGEAVLTYWLY